MNFPLDYQTKTSYNQDTKENVMSLELKIKSKHLTEEAKIIRFEEKKLLRQVRWLNQAQREADANKTFSKWNSLNVHRRHDVRIENRATFLARAFLANRPYTYIEQKRSPEFEYYFQALVLPRVVAMVNKYGSTQVNAETLKQWTTLPTV
jgi:hypothetical protein